MVKGAELPILESITHSAGKELATPTPRVPARATSNLLPPYQGGSTAAVLLTEQSAVESSAIEPDKTPLEVKNTRLAATTRTAAHISTPRAELTSSGASRQDADDPNTPKSKRNSQADASKSPEVTLKSNTSSSDAIPKKRNKEEDLAALTVVAHRASAVEPESSAPERTDAKKPTQTRADGGAMYSFMVNDYLTSIVLLVAIIILAILPSGGTGQRGIAESGSKINPAFEACPAQEQQEGDQQSKLDSELGATEKLAVPAIARAHAGGASTVTSRMLFLLNFVLWVSLAMGFSAYAKGYLRQTREPIGLLVLQGITGIAILSALARFGTIYLHPLKASTPVATRRIGLASAMHTGQALLTNFAVILGGVAATNALKAMEPIAAAFFSYLLLGKSCSGSRLASIFVIAAGIIMFTCTSFDVKGGGGGEGEKFSDRAVVGISTIIVVGAVCCNALRNVFIKKGDPIPPHQTLFACSVVAAGVGIGMMLLRQMFGVMDDLTSVGAGNTRPSSSGGAGGVDWLRVTGVNASLCFVGYNFASFNLLACLTPVGHAVGNSFKRVLVFAGGLLFLGEVMSNRQLGGAALALGGVLAYNVGGARK